MERRDITAAGWRTIRVCFLRLLCGVGAFVALAIVSGLHAYLRGLAYHHHLFSAVSLDSIEDLGGPDAASRFLQWVVPPSSGGHAAFILWSSLFWLSPLLAFAVGAGLGPRQYGRLLLLHTSVIAVCDLIFFIVPTMPPWMADGTPRLLSAYAGNALQIDTNPTAAFPSLHVAVPLIAGVWLLHSQSRLWRIVGVVWVIRAMLLFWAVVYTGEHYVLDGAAAIVIVLLVYRFYDWLGWAQEPTPRRDRAPAPRRAAVPAAADASAA
ncbi:MAG TPA: phosphatase PAP2 family protein [Dehalococcoidia bacterium]|nr:phosphatase PAP2 family protein [Dehalococcoidia bacterium]